MSTEKERNREALDRIAFHLDQAMRLYDELDLSDLDPLEEKEWADRMKTCKDAIEFTKRSIQRLKEILSRQ